MRDWGRLPIADREIDGAGGRWGCIQEPQSKLAAAMIFERSSFRLAFGLVASVLLLAGCSGASDPQGNGGRGGRGGPGGPTPVGFVVVQQGSAPIQQELPGRVAAYQVSDVRPAGFGRDPQTAVYRGIARPPGSDALSDRPQHLFRTAGPGGRQSAERPSERSRGPDARAALCAARENGGDLQAGLHRRTRPGPPGGRFGRAEQCRAASCADQHALHPGACADQRADQPVERHRRCAGHCEPGRRAGNHHPAGPGLCRHPAIGRGTARRCARRWRRAAPFRPARRCG